MSEPSIADAITSDLGNEPTPETPSVPATPETAPAPQPTPSETKPAVNGSAAPEATPAPPAAPQPAQTEPEDKTVRGLIHALGDERDKRQSERKLREAAERRVAEYESERSRPQIPDAVNQPEEFQAYLNGVVEQTQLNATMTISQNFASREFGNDKVQEASKWGWEQGPQFVQWFRAQHDPFGWLMQQHQRHELAEKIGKDPDAWARQRVSELGQNGAAPLATGQAPPAQPQPIPQAQQAVVPKSLASQPSAGGTVNSVPVHDLAAFDGLFRGSG